MQRMDARVFDRLTRTIATRTSRRAALASGGLGITAALTSRLAPAAYAQGATPMPAEDVSVLYVQTFSTATIAPESALPGAFMITLEGSTGQTVYFSDRPERLVGTLTDEAFLDGRAFGPSNPPNAAIVNVTRSAEEILIVELTEPAYDPATGAVTYAATVLEGQPESDTLISLAARHVHTEIQDTTGPVTLFIDQLACSNGGCSSNSDCCSGQCCLDNEECPYGMCL
jgi:hypothetical protein